MAEQRRKMNTPTYGNLAYDLDALVRERNLDEAGRMPRTERHEQPQIQRRSRSAAQPRLHVSPLLAGSLVALVVAVVVMMFGYVQLTKTTVAVSQLESQLSDLQGQHVDLLTRYEQTFDLATIKQVAERAGMEKPSSGQIEYVDLSGSDSVTVYNGQSDGLLHKAAASIGQGAKSVVEYFR